MPPSPEEIEEWAVLYGKDGQLSLEMDTARAWGVSWRRFHGWEPARTTVYEYDDAGRLVRSVTTVEPEWDGPERRAAMALLVFESGLCPGCRQPLAETTRPEREFAYKAGQAIRCHRCTAMEQAHAKYENAPAPGALLIPIVTSGG